MDFVTDRIVQASEKQPIKNKVPHFKQRAKSLLQKQNDMKFGFTLSDTLRDMPLEDSRCKDPFTNEKPEDFFARKIRL